MRSTVSAPAGVRRSTTSDGRLRCSDFRSRRVVHLAAGALDARHVGAEVGEQHAAELYRADAGEFDDPDPGQWPAHRRASKVSVISGHLYI